MSHSKVRIWIHAVWGTKFRRPFLQPAIEKKVHSYMKEQFKEMGCPVNIIGGTEDHVHVLFLLSTKHSVGQIIKNVKGKTCHWIRTENLTKNKFEWQVGYYATGIDNENLDRVFHYICNQKLHHKKQSFDAEYQELIKESESFNS
jgi:putative transposase